MSIEATPLQEACNLDCAYCSEKELRDARPRGLPRYNIEAMFTALRRLGKPFVVFGGEPLLLPVPELERFFALSMELWRALPEAQQATTVPNTIQTNGALLSKVHIDLFRRYRVRVGFSIDGPGELNDARADRRGLGATRLMTARSCAALDLLLREGMRPSLIVTLHKLNASPDRLPRLRAWLADSAARGVSGIRLHLMAVYAQESRAFRLDDTDALAAMRTLGDVGPPGWVDYRRDLDTLLRGHDGLGGASEPGLPCVWSGCDPWTTPGVHGIDGEGRSRNCEMVAWGGRNIFKVARPTQVRQAVLYRTPQTVGGCQGCRFFVACKGQCPGHAIDQDWRNRTADCRVWFGLLEAAEQRLLRLGVEPVSLRTDLPLIEAAMLRRWEANAVATIQAGIAEVERARNADLARTMISTILATCIGEEVE